MNAGSRSLRRVADGSRSTEHVCRSCLIRLSSIPHRRYAATAAAAVAEPSSTPPPDTTHPVTASSPEKAFAVLASPVISRAPVITRELSSFEKAFYLYQKRLNERTALPFTRYFYYKAGSLDEKDWKRKFRGRKSATRDIGQYSGYGSEAWNDEVLVGDRTGEWESQVQALLNDAAGKTISGAESIGEAEKVDEIVGAEKPAAAAAVTGVDKAEIARPMPRKTEADEKNDVKSLNRRLDRILYLLVQNKSGKWTFPQDRVYGRENLAQASERILVQAAGINMNTWMVGNHPIGYHSSKLHPKQAGTTITIPSNELVSSSRELERAEYGEKVFFMRGRIMAGQADLSKNIYGDKDFRWLTREEIQTVVSEHYWSSIRSMLTDR